jgi:hypothetical protein
MSSTFKGIDIRETSDRLVFRVSLKSVTGSVLTTGTTTLSIYELQNDGSLKSFDFFDNTFKTTVLTTPMASMTHRTGNNGGTDTGIWTYTQTVLSGFTSGMIYFSIVSNSSASPTQQEREFQFGLNQEDITAIGTPISIDGGTATLAGMITKLADDNNGLTYDATTDSLNKLKSAIIEGVPAAITTAVPPTITTGTLISGTYADTILNEADYLVIAPVTPAVGGFGLNAYLTYTLTSNQRVNTLHLNGRFQAGGTRYCNVYAYNWTTLEWDQLSDSVTRMNKSNTDVDYEYTLFPEHKDISGTVQIGFMSPSTDTTDRLYLDQVIIDVLIAGATASEIAEAVYLKMAYTVYDGMIHIDTVNGVAGSDVGVHGTPTNPVNNIDDALTLSGLLNIDELKTIPYDTITLDQTMENWTFHGSGIIELNSQNITGTTFIDNHIQGIGTGDHIHFINCEVRTCSLGPFRMVNCSLSGAVTLLTIGNYTLMNCATSIPTAGTLGGITPEFIFGTGAYYLGLRNYSGAARVTGMTADCRLAFEGNGFLKISSNCTGGTIAIRGNVTILDEVVGGFQGTIVDDARWSEEQTISHVVDIPSDGSGFTDIGDERMAHLMNISAGPGALDSDVTSIINTLNDQETKILEMYELYGLDPTKPLIVSLSERRAGTIRQTVVSSNNNQTTTVTRIE